MPTSQQWQLKASNRVETILHSYLRESAEAAVDPGGAAMREGPDMDPELDVWPAHSFSCQRPLCQRMQL